MGKAQRAHLIIFTLSGEGNGGHAALLPTLQPLFALDAAPSRWLEGLTQTIPKIIWRIPRNVPHISSLFQRLFASQPSRVHVMS